MTARAWRVGAWLALAGLVGIAIFMGGCADQVREARDTAASVATDARDRAAQHAADLERTRLELAEARALGLEAQAARIEAVAQGLEAQLAVARATAATADELVATADRALADAASAEGIFEQVPVLNLLPPAYREGAALLVAGGLALWRNRKLRGAATSIAQAFEAIRKADPAADELLRRHAGTLRATQTATAQKLVDEVQHKRTPLLAL